VQVETERPRLYKVILLNDDYTPRESIVTVLKGEFRMREEEAYRVMITAHKRGVCVVAVFAKDVAETRQRQRLRRAAAKVTLAVHHRARRITHCLC
jgi:ATP-dependent Clp protease adaptor protein ClpS